MASRSRVEFDERESYYSDRGPRRGREEVEFYERRESHERRAPSRGPPATVVREREREREREVDRESRVPAFMREDARRPDAGALVLRQREVETIERPRHRRSPSPVRVRETRLVERARSVSPRRRLEEEDVRVRMVERERIRSPSRGPSMERVRTRIVERERSLSPPSPPVMDRVRTRIVERERSVSPGPPARIDRIQTRYIERGRSPSPVDRERIRIIERERERIPSPSPSPPPPVIKGPVIEREVITHYRDIDHGMVPARLPSPPPPPRTRAKERDTEIDVYTSRNTTEIDIHKSTHHERSASRDRRPPPPRLEHVRGDEIVIASERDRLEVDIQDRHHDRLEVDIHERHRHRRAQSAAPPSKVDYAEEAEYITSKIDSRGRMGEAYHGATRDWTIVDVPPGTDRVRMDGVGGGGAEVTWQRYNGVRRAKFIPERERESVVSSSSISDREIAVRDRVDYPRESRLSVQVHDKHRDHEIDVDVEKVTDRRIALRPPAPVRKPETWTEITKDLIVREAIEELGYDYEETDFFFYVMQYLRYEDVLQLVQLSDQIRRERKERIREIQWETEWRDELERDHHHRNRRRHRHRHSHSHDRWEEERTFEREREREVVVDHRGPTRGYIR